MVVPAPNARTVGINLAGGHFAYGGTAHLMLDRMLGADPWTVSMPGRPDFPAPVDARGYPTSIPAGATQVGCFFPTDGAGKPGQRYVALTNKRDLTFSTAGIVAALSRSDTMVFEPYQWARSDPNWSMGTLAITALGSPFQPDEYIRVVRYDRLSEFENGSIYSAPMLDKLRRFGAIRFMDWLHTNSSPFKTFADLPQVDDQTYNTYNAGVPVAACCKLANDLKVSIAELPVPHQFDNASVDKFVAQIRDTLTGRYSCAYSNEMGWQFNAAFLQGVWANEKGNERAFMAKLPQGGSRPLQYYAYRATQVMQRAIKAFAGKRDRLVTNLGFQAVWPSTLYRKEGALLAARELGINAKTLGDCGFDVGQVAAYFGIPSENDVDRAKVVAWAKGGTAGLDAAFRAMMDGTGLTTTVPYRSIADQARLFKQWKTVLDAEHMRLGVYEWSHAMPLTGYSAQDRPFVFDLRHRMRADNRMATGYAAMHDALAAAGCDLSYQFADVASEVSGDTDWFVWQTESDPETPASRWMAQVNGFILPAH
ncbi:hypothetical protein [Sphingomonas nostoxanthinifaciens]|uniref:hypothetical protein n=1 Tax=Sphingomonas nostoxanthinifaciens TaxID=2872652 RepID=UPI001CC20692|nr:hypothetical protein [Sphingomonas nostoxanthinifaciens]UAK23196.1 hypothetical protein K8P63_12330 [Sphingomonas nostoxanthinifaciens]